MYMCDFEVPNVLNDMQSHYARYNYQELLTTVCFKIIWYSPDHEPIVQHNIKFRILIIIFNVHSYYRLARHET